MISLANLLKQARLEAGMTQDELATATAVSLPTIQNLEAGRGNPSFKTLSALLGELGMELIPHRQPAHWQVLEDLGLAMGPGGAGRDQQIASGELFKFLRLAAHELIQDLEDGSIPAHNYELYARLLWAIEAHFPSRWNSLVKRCDSIARVQHELRARGFTTHDRLPSLLLQQLVGLL